MKKKVLCMILASIFCLCGLGMLAGCGEETPDDGYQSPFYTLEDACEQRLISEEELGEFSDYITTVGVTRLLHAEAVMEIKEALRAKYLQKNTDATNINVEDFQFDSFGVYGKCYIIVERGDYAEDSNAKAYKMKDVKSSWQDYNPQAQSGFYTLNEAYLQGVLLPSDLQMISYYFKNAYPEELTADELSMLQEALKEKFLQDYSQEEIERIESSYGIDAEDFEIRSYKGCYNGAYVFAHVNPYFMYSADMTYYSYKIGDLILNFGVSTGTGIYVYKA